MKPTLFLIFLLVFAGCNTSGPDYPADADEILDFGIVYARYGDEWWSVKDGEKWNHLGYNLKTAVIYPKKGKQVVIEDFGSYASIIESVVFYPYSDEPVWTVIFYRHSWVNNEAALAAYTRAWNTGKYKKIVLSCAMGCMIAP